MDTITQAEWEEIKLGTTQEIPVVNEPKVIDLTMVVETPTPKSLPISISKKRALEDVEPLESDEDSDDVDRMFTHILGLHAIFFVYDDLFMCCKDLYNRRIATYSLTETTAARCNFLNTGYRVAHRSGGCTHIFDVYI